MPQIHAIDIGAEEGWRGATTAAAETTREAGNYNQIIVNLYQNYDTT